jgi:hypothetical protein
VIAAAEPADDLAGVHAILGVPDPLELAERTDQLGAELLDQQLAARLAVAVLARQRAAVADAQVGRVVGEPLVARDALGRR